MRQLHILGIAVAHPLMLLGAAANAAAAAEAAAHAALQHSQTYTQQSDSPVIRRQSGRRDELHEHDCVRYQ